MLAQWITVVRVDGLRSYSVGRSVSASITRAENTSAAPAFTAIATPSASAISSFVAPCCLAA